MMFGDVEASVVRRFPVSFTGRSGCGVPATGVLADTSVREQDCGVLEVRLVPVRRRASLQAPADLPAAPGRDMSQPGGRPLETVPVFDGSQRHIGDPEELRCAVCAPTWPR